MILGNLIKLLNNRIFFLIFYALLLVFALVPYYTDGTVILGGEGDFALDFSSHLSKHGFMWVSLYGVGLPNMAPTGTGLNILFLSLIEKLTRNIAITNFALIFSIYFFPFFAMYLVCKKIKSTPFTSFVISFFYVVNPFMLYYLINLNQWNVFSVSVMPMFLWIILKYYYSNFKLFFFFGILSAAFSFAYSNVPLLAIIQISIVFSVFMVSYYYNKRLILSQIFKKYTIVFVSFISFNLWWILSLLEVIMPATQKIYSPSFAQSWLETTVSGHRPIIAKMFLLKGLIGNNPSYDFFTYLYNTIFAHFITLVPILLIIYFVLISRDKKTKNLLNITIFSVLLIVLFLLKGNANPFGFIYNLMFKHLPFFYMFKSPTEKFGLLYIFIFTVLLMLILNGLNQQYYKPIMTVFIIYLIFCSIPALTGNIIPDYNIGAYGYVSRKYKDKMEYKQVREVINNDKYPYRVLSLPGSQNYQVAMSNYNNKKYTGLDPVLMNTNKPFIALQHHIDLLYDHISSRNYRKLLGLYNIGEIMINEDLVPWFGVRESESVPELKKIFDEYMTSKRWGRITLYYNNQDYFLPRIYAAPLSAPIK